MKKTILFLGALLSAAVASADYRAVFYSGGAPVSQTKVQNIQKISSDGASITQLSDDTTKVFPLASVDSVVFFRDTVFINYSAAGASVDNPLAPLGLDVVAAGAAVQVLPNPAFDLKDVVFVLAGQSADGSFLMKQNKRTSVVFDNLNLASLSGAAVAFVGDKSVSLQLVGDNHLADMATRALGDTLDAALYVYDNLSISGSGSLSVQGRYKKGIFAKDDLTVDGATITVSALSSAIRVKDNFVLNAGSVSLVDAEDLLEANDSIIINGGSLVADALVDEGKCLDVDAAYVQRGGEVRLTLTGASARGVKVGTYEVAPGDSLPGSVLISGGSLSVEAFSPKATSLDPPKAAAIKADGDVTISGGVVSVVASASSHAVRGVAADGAVVINGSAQVSLNIQSEKGSAWCIKSDSISIKEGTVEAVFNENNKKFPSAESGYFSSTPVSIP